MHGGELKRARGRIKALTGEDLCNMHMIRAQTNILPRFCEKCLDFFFNLKDMINILWLRLKPRPSRERVDRVLNKYTYTSLVTDSLILFRSPRHIV